MECAIGGCVRPALARGWCRRHYERWIRHGDPLGGGPSRDRSPEERFWAKVDRHLPGCWFWTGARNGAGYPYLWVDGRQVRAHRFAYELLVGPIPAGLTLDHVCRVRHCVNPGHLEPLPIDENAKRAPHYVGNRTHCPQGHPYDEANTYISRAGTRNCRACARDRYHRRRAAA